MSHEGDGRHRQTWREITCPRCGALCMARRSFPRTTLHIAWHLDLTGEPCGLTTTRSPDAPTHESSTTPLGPTPSRAEQPARRHRAERPVRRLCREWSNSINATRPHMSRVRRSCLGCGILVRGSYCSACDPKSGNHRRLHAVERRRWATTVATGQVECSRCSQPIAPGQAWDIDKRPTGWHPSHASCNRSAGGRGEP